MAFSSFALSESCCAPRCFTAAGNCPPLRFPSCPGKAAKRPEAGDTVTAGGNYTLSKDIAAGTIYISTTDPVINSGDGVTIDEKGQITSDAYKNLKFDCSAVTGANLTLKDMFLEDRSDTSPLVNFAGLDNKLNFEGTVVMDKYGSGQGTYANIHVSLPWR